MSSGELVVVALVVAAALALPGFVVLALVLRRRRADAFAAFVAARRWVIRPGAGPWIERVAEGTVGARTFEVGLARSDASGESWMRVRTLHRAPVPPGTWIHAQPFRTNTSTAVHGPYDGRYDDPATSSLFGSVPEVTVGDPALDRAFVLRGDDPDATRSFVLREPLRTKLLAAAATGAHLRIRAGAVELDADPNELGSVAAYERLLAAVAAVADAIDAVAR